MAQSSHPEPATVVRVIARLNVGGPAIHVMHLSQGLAASYPTLLVHGDVADDEGDMTAEVAARGVRLHRLAGLGRSLRPWDDLTALLALYRLFRRLRPLIVHTHTAKAGTLGRIAALAARVPIRVHTFHGHVFRGYFGRATTAAFLLIERVLARVTTRIVTVSGTQADELAHEFRICPREKVQVIPLGLDLERFAPERTAGLRGEFRDELRAGDRPVISIVARLAPIKNHTLLFDAVSQLVRAGRDPVVAVVGGGSEEMSLRASVTSMGLDGHVRFVGWRTDLARVYAGSDVVALTSNNEGTPVSLIEALAAGRAVVATDVGGVRDVLENGRLGLLVPPGDADALAGALGRLLDDESLRASLGAAGMSSVPARFGSPRLVADMKQLYDELVSHVRGRSAHSARFAKEGSWTY